MSQNNHPHKPLMVQAPVRALDPDGLAVVTAGTIGFAIGAAVCWWSYPQLAAVGKGWYLGTSIAGTVIGLLGLAFGLFRKVRRRHASADGAGTTAPGEPVDAEPDPADELPQVPRRSAGPAEADDPASPERSVEEALVDADGVPHRE